jgi:hypothetical protein
MIRLGVHSNVILCFMVQAFQDPPLCSSTSVVPINAGSAHYGWHIRISVFFWGGGGIFFLSAKNSWAPQAYYGTC